MASQMSRGAIHDNIAQENLLSNSLHHLPSSVVSLLLCYSFHTLLQTLLGGHQHSPSFLSFPMYLLLL